MKHARAWLALLALALVSALGIVLPAQAGAFVSYYNCVNKPNFTWCDGRANGSYDGQHSWDYNQASSGAFTVCQRVYHPSSGSTLIGDNCAYSVASHYYGNVVCVCYDAEVLQFSGGNADINGFADADW